MKAALEKTPDRHVRARERHVSKAEPSATTWAGGNQALVVQRQPLCPCGGGCPCCTATLQPKLIVGQPDDQYEREADQVADQVMRMELPESAASALTLPESDDVHLQRSCLGCGEKKEEDEILRTQADPFATPEVTPALESQLQFLRGGGQPLPESTRNFFEPRFGQDFSQVRIHSDARAAEAAKAVHARAFTVGKDVVLGEGQYSPDSDSGKRLLAHELVHVGQKQNSSMRLRPTVDSACPNYQPDEVRISHSDIGHIDPDVRMIAPGRLLIADFGVDWRHLKGSTRENPLLSLWLNTFEFDNSYKLSIIGYSDCVGVEWNNTSLRQGRAKRVEELLGSKARSRLTFSGKAALDSFVTDNNNIEARAINRGVVIEFHQEFVFPTQEVLVSPERCGPNITQWLVDQMNANRDHPTIQTMREIAWPLYIPVFNIGWTSAALTDFASLVGSGRPWDFKNNQEWWRAGSGRSCPTAKCDTTITMCGMCFNYDVPGNIHYGWIGTAAGLRSKLLHTAAGIVQPGQWTDDPKDAVAVDIGIAMWDNGTSLCDEIRKRRSQLNLGKTENCLSCTQP